MDGAIFYDAGKVASRVEDLTLRDLESDYGIGFRFARSTASFSAWKAHSAAAPVRTSS
jgi:hypothetical protein